LTEIFGPIKERAECRKRCDEELYRLYRSPDVTSIRISRLRWARHVERVSDDILKRSMDCKEDGRRRIGRPKLRWIDGVLEDIKTPEVTIWWTVVRVREAWKLVFREAQAHTGL
jgi:hypothetical protein